jgi:hypothetical protein
MNGDITQIINSWFFTDILKTKNHKYLIMTITLVFFNKKE